MRRGLKSIPGSATTIAGTAGKGVGKHETLEGSWNPRRRREAGLKRGWLTSSGHFSTSHSSSRGRSTKITGQNWST
ncbi:unnamed protein product [Prunus armeniaca]